MIIISLAVLAASAFGGVAEPEPVADVLTPELLARVIGEAGGVGVWETEEAKSTAWRFVLWVALNRHRDSRFPAALGLLDGFYRLDPSPPPEAIEMARQVMEADPRDDPTGACVYALSAQDLELLGVEIAGDIMLKGVGLLELHFYRRWPVAGRS